MGQRARYLVWTVRVFSHYSLSATASWSTAACFHKNVERWVFLVWYNTGRKVWSLALGLLLWAPDGVVRGEPCWWASIAEGGRGSGEMPGGAMCVVSWTKADLPRSLPDYFPRIDMSHDLKPSMTFMIYGWNAGKIFHSLLCVPFLCFYMKSVTPLQKKIITDVAENHCFSVALSVLELRHNLDTVLFF